MQELNLTNTLLRDCWTDTERGVLLGLPKSAICVQRFDDSLNSAIRITYRISLRSSSLREPRYPLLRVVFFNVQVIKRVNCSQAMNRRIEQHIKSQLAKRGWNRLICNVLHIATVHDWRSRLKDCTQAQSDCLLSRTKYSCLHESTCNSWQRSTPKHPNQHLWQQCQLILCQQGDVENRCSIGWYVDTC